MKISKITSQKKKPDRFNVFIEDEFWLGISANTLSKFKLYDGLEITEKEASEISRAEIRGKLMERAIQYLSRSIKPRARVRRYLKTLLYKKKGDWLGEFDEKDFIETIEEILNDLEEKKIIDDLAFARSFVEVRLARRPRSRAFILNELLMKGIAKENAELALSESGEDDLETLKVLLDKKYGSTVIDRKDLKKIRFLMSRGFSWEVISRLANDD